MVIYALFLYQKPIKWWRVIAATLLVTLVVNVLMNTYWLHLLYGLDLRAAFLQRILKRVNYAMDSDCCTLRDFKCFSTC